MNLMFYNIYEPKKYNKQKSLHAHNLYYSDNFRILVPQEFSKTSVNPENFYKIRESVGLDGICIVDKLHPNMGPVCIIDHVNRSGTNFLIGKTPIESLPVFPDMSKIYNRIPGYKQVVVHTLGPNRFSKQKEQDYITSESTGLVSPVWHYVGVDVFAKNNMLLDINKHNHRVVFS